MKTIHNERLELSSTFLNGVSIAIVVIGGITPVIHTLVPTDAPPDPGRTLPLVLACLTIAAILHFTARLLLGGLRE